MAGRFKSLLALVATCLGLADVGRVTMAEGVGIPLENHLAGFIECKGEASQPADHPPDEAMIDDGLMERGRLRKNLVRSSLGALRRGVLNGISDTLSVVLYRVSITDLRMVWLIAIGILLSRIPEEAFGGLNKARGGEPLIGQDEKRGSR